MIINFEKVGHCKRKKIAQVLNEALEVTGNNGENIVVTVSFVNEKEIRRLNKLHRKVDRVTDVLSFPMLDIKYPQKLEEFKDDISPDGRMYIGDIAICKKRAKQQAKEYGHGKQREICFLALHGFLHLLGFDHIEEADEKIMTATSKAVLEKLNITRGKNV